MTGQFVTNGDQYLNNVIFIVNDLVHPAEFLFTTVQNIQGGPKKSATMTNRR